MLAFPPTEKLILVLQRIFKRRRNNYQGGIDFFQGGERRIGRMSSVQFAGVVVADRCNKWDNDVTVQATRGIIIRVLSPFPFVHQEIALPSDVLSSLDMLGSILSEFFHPRIFITLKSTKGLFDVSISYRKFLSNKQGGSLSR